MQKPRSIHIPMRKSNPAATLHTLLNGLSGTLSKITAQVRDKEKTEDYISIVKSFMPENARLLIPKHPYGAKEVQFANLDGSTQKGLVASFQLDNEIRTLFLKKQDEYWYKDAEISCYGYDSLDYRDTADLTGDGKKQLMLGVSSGNESPTLYTYSLDDGVFIELFARSYDKIELLPSSRGPNSHAKTWLALWSKKDENTYDIEVLRWNGSELVPVKNPAFYYFNRVAPHYAMKIRQTPDDAHLWYNLAEALAKAGAYKDSVIAINAGMKHQMDPSLKNRYVELKRSLLN